MELKRERVERLLEHLRHIEGDDVGFNYCSYFENDFGGQDPKHWSKSTCGTHACVAGHTILLFPEMARKMYRKLCEAPFGSVANAFNVAKEVLGLDHADAYGLFLKGIHADHSSISDAIARLEHMLEHGDLEDYDYNSEHHLVLVDARD